MSGYSESKDMERRVRSSKAYHDWVGRNRTPFCFSCGASEGLECHHVITLYTILRSLHKLYGDDRRTIHHAIAMHEDDRVECVTLCSRCHGKTHPGRSPSAIAQDARVEEWTTAPRVLPFVFNHTRHHRKDAVNLLGFQVLLGLGWHILNGKAKSRTVTFNRRRFAEMLGKEPGSSFNTGLDAALMQLRHVGFVDACSTSDSDKAEITMSAAYCVSLRENPWFFPLKDVPANRMCVLAVRWMLGFHGKRKTYKIGLSKLLAQLGIETNQKNKAVEILKESCAVIPWVKFGYDGEFCSFEMVRRGAIPVFSLRQMLDDSLESMSGPAMPLSE